MLFSKLWFMERRLNKVQKLLQKVRNSEMLDSSERQTILSMKEDLCRIHWDMVLREG